MVGCPYYLVAQITRKYTNWRNIDMIRFLSPSAMKKGCLLAINNLTYSVKSLFAKALSKTSLDTYAIHFAAQYGYSDIFKLLAENNIPIDTPTVVTAAQNGHVEIIKFLLTSGKVRMYDGSRTLHQHAIESAVLTAATCGQETVIKCFLDNEAPIWKEAAYIAAQNGHTGILKILLDAKNFDCQEVMSNIATHAYAEAFSNISSICWRPETHNMSNFAKSFKFLLKNNIPFYKKRDTSTSSLGGNYPGNCKAKEVVEAFLKYECRFGSLDDVKFFAEFCFNKHIDGAPGKELLSRAEEGRYVAKALQNSLEATKAKARALAKVQQRTGIMCIDNMHDTFSYIFSNREKAKMQLEEFPNKMVTTKSILEKPKS